MLESLLGLPQRSPTVRLLRRSASPLVSARQDLEKSCVAGEEVWRCCLDTDARNRALDRFGE
jgi:hypothetical protein